MKLYDSDFYAWTVEQAKLLQEGNFKELDIANLIEEVQTLGRTEKRELTNRLGKLLGHLLKWQYQPEKQGTSWCATINEQRTRVKEVIKENPSLKPYLEEAIKVAYKYGRNLAVKETKKDYSTFPEKCPYSIAQIFDDNFPFN